MSEEGFPHEGYRVHDWDPFIVRFTENFGLRWYGLSYVLGFIVAVFLRRSASTASYDAVSLPEESLDQATADPPA